MKIYATVFIAIMVMFGFTQAFDLLGRYGDLGSYSGSGLNAAFRKAGYGNGHRGHGHGYGYGGAGDKKGYGYGKRRHGDSGEYGHGGRHGDSGEYGHGGRHGDSGEYGHGGRRGGYGRRHGGDYYGRNRFNSGYDSKFGGLFGKGRGYNGFSFTY